jgi:hypothetical protein
LVAKMTDAFLGIGLICFSASLWIFARALRHKPVLPEATGPIITSNQWARLRERAMTHKAAPPRRGAQSPHGLLN